MKNLVRRAGIAIPALLVGGIASIGLYAHAAAPTASPTTGQHSTVQAGDPVDQPDTGASSTKDGDTIQSGPQSGSQVDGVDVGHVDAGGTESADPASATEGED